MTSENGDAADRRHACPNYGDALRINEWFRPDVLVGYHLIVNADVGRALGLARPIAGLWTNRLLLSTLHPSGFHFGASFHEDGSERSDRRSPGGGGGGSGAVRVENAYVQTDLDGHWAAGARHAFRRYRVQACSRQSPPGRGVAQVQLERIGEAANWRLSWTCGSLIPTVVSADHVFRLGRCGLRFGQKLSFAEFADGTRYWRPESWDYGGVLRYDRDAAAVSVSVTRAMDAAVRCRHAVNGRLTVGVEVTANLRAVGRLKSVWTHRFAVGDGVEIRGLLDTDGMVVGNLYKEFLPNLSVGLCTILNHKNSNFGLGLEITIGPKSKQDSFNFH